jgi:hypothetical protein
MQTTVYLHPERTIIAHWSAYDQAPVLDSYIELQPQDDIRSNLLPDAQCTVSVHASATRWHHFPVDPDEDVILRRGFELATCMPDVDPDIDLVSVVNDKLESNGRIWCGMCIVPRHISDDIVRRIGPEARIVPDVVSDIHAARMTITPQQHPWALVGLRGERWVCALISPEHVITQCVAFPRDATQSFVEGALESFYGIRSTTHDAVDHVLFYGDELTKSIYDELASELATQSVRIGRLQPFRRVAAAVDDSVKRSLLAVAHILSPIVAPVLPQFEEIESGANP